MEMLFNVHTVPTEALEKVLNAHAQRGWAVRWLRGFQAQNIVVFERMFETSVERDEFQKARYARKKAEPKLVKSASS